MCDLGDFEPCEVFDLDWRKARGTYRGKPVKHICEVCRHPIVAGNLYLHHFSIFDGHMTTEKVCVVCGTLWQSFFEAHHGGRSPASIEEMLVDCIAETSNAGNYGAGYWDTVEESKAARASMRKVDGQWRTYLAIIRRRRSRAPKEENAPKRKKNWNVA